MKCKDCDSCKKGFWASKPEAYICIGVKEPFEIHDINSECTEYPEKNTEQQREEVCQKDRVLTLVEDIYAFIGDPVDYAELIGSEVPSTYGMYYVYTEPEEVLLDVAAKMIVSQKMEIDRLREQIDGLKRTIDDLLDFNKQKLGG